MITETSSPPGPRGYLESLESAGLLCVQVGSRSYQGSCFFSDTQLGTLIHGTEPPSTHYRHYSERCGGGGFWSDWTAKPVDSLRRNDNTPVSQAKGAHTAARGITVE